MLVLQLFVGLLAVVTYPNYVKAKERAKEAEVKANTHLIQIALERYAIDHNGMYPESTDDLFDLNYMSEPPRNPFTEGTSEFIEFGESGQGGNRTYVPVSNDKGVYGYYLFSYCDTCPGQDIDGDGVQDKVILVLSSGNNAAGFPTLEEVLKE